MVVYSYNGLIHRKALVMPASSLMNLGHRSYIRSQIKKKKTHIVLFYSYETSRIDRAVELKSRGMVAELWGESRTDSLG